MQRNTACSIPFFIGTTGLSPTVQGSKDGAEFAALSGTVSETGLGWYAIEMSSGDMDAATIAMHIEAGGSVLDALVETDSAADDVHTKEIEDGFSLSRTLRVIAAAVGGKVRGGPNAPIFRNLGDSTDMIIGNADGDGNRTSASYGT
jgi:hypothetical protein